MKSPVRPEMPAYLQKLFDKYKYILLVCLVGLVLLLWPQSEPELRETASAAREGLGEAAALLRLPVPTVSTRLRRARARLAQLLSEEVDA